MNRAVGFVQRDGCNRYWPLESGCAATRLSPPWHQDGAGAWVRSSAGCRLSDPIEGLEPSDERQFRAMRDHVWPWIRNLEPASSILTLANQEELYPLENASKAQ